MVENVTLFLLALDVCHGLLTKCLTFIMTFIY